LIREWRCSLVHFCFHKQVVYKAEDRRVERYVNQIDGGAHLLQVIWVHNLSPFRLLNAILDLCIEQSVDVAHIEYN